MATKEYALSGFTKVDVRGVFEVNITRSDTFKVSINADQTMLERLDVVTDGDTLKVRHRWRFFDWPFQAFRPEVSISMPAIRDLSMAGANKAILSGFKSTDDFRIRLAGADDVRGTLTSGNVRLELTGAARVDLTGSGGDIAIEAAGACHADLEKFAARNASIRFTGASSGIVNLDGTLDANLIGASTLKWTGKPVMGNIKLAGASSLSKK